MLFRIRNGIGGIVSKAALFFAVFAGAAVVSGTPAVALCSKPIVPYCASDGDLSDSYVSLAECSRKVKGHLAELERFKVCLSEAIDEVDREAGRLRDLISDAADGPERSGRASPAARQDVGA